MEELYCLSGTDRIIVKPNGNICRCYSRLSSYTNIYDFDIKRDLVLKKCDFVDCGVCDTDNAKRHGTIKGALEQKRDRLLIEMAVTGRCFYFCPYCQHSDNSQFGNYPIKEIPIIKFTEFLNKIPPSIILILGGEPTLRNDLHELFTVRPKHEFQMLSACLIKTTLKKIIETTNKTKIKLFIAPTVHLYAKGFIWDLFWDNMRLINDAQYVHLSRIQLINYKAEPYIDRIKTECKKLNIRFDFKTLDTTIMSERIDTDYLKQKEAQFNFKKITCFRHI